jgi:ribosomal-protein-alanine N-acetyltransferase
LLHAVCAEARLRGGRTMFLEVATRNAPARELYRQFGFIEVGRRRGYYADASDAVVLRMNIA